LGKMKCALSSCNCEECSEQTNCQIYRSIKWKCYKGVPSCAIAAAREYIGFRLKEYPISLEEIAEKHDISVKDVSRALRILLKNEDILLPLIGPDKWIERFYRELSLHEIKDEALSIHATTKDRLWGSSPPIAAAAIIYITTRKYPEKTKQRLTQKQLAELAHCTEVSIRNACKRILNEVS